MVMKIQKGKIIIGYEIQDGIDVDKVIENLGQSLKVTEVFTKKKVMLDIVGMEKD